jgi:c-di-GMP-binding flagellar brake protein YcgR
MAVETIASQRRRDRRVKQWNKATIKALSGPLCVAGGNGTEAFTYDLSLSGARIHSTQLFEAGTKICLRIELARSREAVAIDGCVMWARPCEAPDVYEMGVEFNHSSSQTILSLIKSLHDNRR